MHQPSVSILLTLIVWNVVHNLCAKLWHNDDAHPRLRQAHFCRHKNRANSLQYRQRDAVHLALYTDDDARTTSFPFYAIKNILTLVPDVLSSLPCIIYIYALSHVLTCARAVLRKHITTPTPSRKIFIWYTHICNNNATHMHDTITIHINSMCVSGVRKDINMIRGLRAPAVTCLYYIVASRPPPQPLQMSP